MKGSTLRTLAITALAVGMGVGPAFAAGQDAGENGNPRSGNISANSGFAVCMDGAAQQPRCYMGYEDGGKFIVLGQGSDYNGNSIIERVDIDPAAKDGGATQGTGRVDSTADGITLHIFFVYLGKLDLTVTPEGTGVPGASGLGCADNRLVYKLGSPASAIQPSTLSGNLHVFGQDYPLTPTETSGPCNVMWAGQTAGGYYMAPPNTAGNPV